MATALLSGWLLLICPLVINQPTVRGDLDRASPRIGLKASNLADNVVFSCGLPTNPSAVTHADAQEETLFTTTLVGQDVGAPAVQWMSQQVTAAANLDHSSDPRLMAEASASWRS